MNETMRALAAELRAMPSPGAADWLLQHYPSGGEAITLLEHVSLRRSDYQRLAEHYLSGRSHAHDRAYRLFARRLGLSKLIHILAAMPDRDSDDARLLAYHIKPLLNEAKVTGELRDAATFLAALELA